MPKANHQPASSGAFSAAGARGGGKPGDKKTRPSVQYATNDLASPGY
jgi:hypothetical protein